MKPIRLLTAIVCICAMQSAQAQEMDKSASISIFTGAMNYQGDLKPNTFTIENCSFTTGITVRKPLNHWFALRAGANMGTIKASDSWNDDNLRPRNLSFSTTIKEAYLGLEVSILDMSSGFFTPYVYAGIAAFHFNPWTKDNNRQNT